MHSKALFLDQNVFESCIFFHLLYLAGQLGRRATSDKQKHSVTSACSSSSTVPVQYVLGLGDLPYLEIKLGIG